MAEPARDLASELGSIEEIAVSVARYLHGKRAEDVVVLRVRELLPIASYFVLASAGSSRSAQTLSDGLQKLLKGTPLERRGIHGRREGRWVCLDYDEVVVHLFDQEARRFYDLENLWAGAPRIDIAFGPGSAPPGEGNVG